MIAGSRSHWKRSVRGLICSMAMIVSGVLAAGAQESDQLQQQLQQLKQQYDVTTRDLEQRISALEQKIENERETREKARENTVSAAKLAAEEAAHRAVLGRPDQVGENFQGQLASEPTYDLLREADVKIKQLKEQVSSFEFHGYFRSGYGLNSAGGEQVAFQAPGADAKYRLGNEAETYGGVDLRQQLDKPGAQFR